MHQGDPCFPPLLPLANPSGSGFVVNSLRGLSVSKPKYMLKINVERGCDEVTERKKRCMLRRRNPKKGIMVIEQQ